jgi:hypothetical protein
VSTIKSSSEHLTINADGAGKDIILQNNGSTKVTVKSDGNMGVGVTPKPWHSAFQAIQVGAATSLFSEVALGSGGSSHLSQNAYYDGAWKTFATGKASTIRQNAGAISFYVNENGTTTAGSDPGFYTPALQITNDGRGLSQFTAKAWVNFNGTGTVAIRDSHNIRSISDYGTGIYGINFTNVLGNDSYATVASSGRVADPTGYNPERNARVFRPRASGFRVGIRGATGGASDEDFVHSIVFGD